MITALLVIAINVAAFVVAFVATYRKWTMIRTLFALVAVLSCAAAGALALAALTGGL